MIYEQFCHLNILYKMCEVHCFFAWIIYSISTYLLCIVSKTCLKSIHIITWYVITIYSIIYIYLHINTSFSNYTIYIHISLYSYIIKFSCSPRWCFKYCTTFSLYRENGTWAHMSVPLLFWHLYDMVYCMYKYVCMTWIVQQN